MEYTGQEGTHNGHPSCCDCPAALKLKVKSLNPVWLFATPWTVACHIPLSVGFSRQEYWSGLPFPSPRDLPNPGIEPRSPSTPGRLFTVWATREAHCLKAEAVMKKNTERRKIFVVLLWCSVQFNSVAQSCLTLCNPINRSTPGLPVHHQLPEFTQTDVHRVSDAIQPSHPLSSPSPPAPNPSHHQGLFQWVNSSHEVAKVLEFQL